MDYCKKNIKELENYGHFLKNGRLRNLYFFCSVFIIHVLIKEMQSSFCSFCFTLTGPQVRVWLEKKKKQTKKIAFLYIVTEIYSKIAVIILTLFTAGYFLKYSQCLDEIQLFPGLFTYQYYKNKPTSHSVVCNTFYTIIHCSNSA